MSWCLRSAALPPSFGVHAGLYSLLINALWVEIPQLKDHFRPPAAGAGGLRLPRLPHEL